MSEPLTPESRSSAPPSGIGARAALLIAGGLAAVGLAGFAGWFANGDTLFWSLLQAGLAWCM
ncbi:MAG: hypothetical protein Kow0026_15420 [Oricola sp.]